MDCPLTRRDIIYASALHRCDPADEVAGLVAQAEATTVAAEREAIKARIEAIVVDRALSSIGRPGGA